MRPSRQPKLFNLGGYEQLPRKVLTYLFPQVFKKFNGQYDFLVKADPDTYLNVARLEKVALQKDKAVCFGSVGVDVPGACSISP